MRWLLTLSLLVIPAAAQGYDDDPAVDPEPPSADAKTMVEGTVAYEKAVAKLKKKRWKSAQKAFRKFIKKYPDHPLVPQAHLRGDENAYLGVSIIHDSGPSDRRIDVAVMGDGFTTDAADQKLQERWAKLCIDVLFNEKGFDEYREYFNIYFVRLASFEEGVDPSLSPEDLKKAQDRNRRRNRDLNYKLDYKTALECKAAGPQGQVMADRSLVYKWLEVAGRDIPGCMDDRFVIAFARFGKLGMGGGGVANVGRPDKSVTVHEFGHAFSRLLDEYAVNPNPPQKMGGMYARSIRAPNAYASLEEPKKTEVPWAHWFKRGVRNKGVGIYEGGATFKKGVWRPARTCAMNVGGNQFCPVCREQSILVIYEYVSPIDTVAPATSKEITAKNGDDSVLKIVPMHPKKTKSMKCRWFLSQLAVTTQGAQEATPEPDGEGPLEEIEEIEDYPDPPDPGGGGNGWGMGRGRNNPFRGPRNMGTRDEYDEPPPGKESKLGKAKRGKKDGYHFIFPLGKLSAGGYEITAEVWDDTPWVVKDPKHLLKQRVTWRVKVAPKD